MNNFEYKMRLNAINNSKYIKELEKYVREYASNRQYYCTLFEKDAEKAYNEFKLLTRAYQLYKERSKKSLPDFILQDINNRSAQLTIYFFSGSAENQNTTYTDFMDVFQYVDIVHFASNDGDLIKNFISLVGSNPMPYKYSLNYKPDWNISASPIKNRLLTIVIEYRNIQLSKRKRYTVLDQIVENELKLVVSSSSVRNEHNNELNNTMIKYYKDRYKAVCDVVQLEEEYKQRIKHE